jgi:hypothetical protein
MIRLPFVALALGIAIILPTMQVGAVAQQAQLSNVPPGMVAYFTQSGQTTCPSGWQEASYAIGRLALPVGTSTNAGISVGATMSDLTPPTHDHAFSGSASVDVHKSGSGGGHTSGIIQSGGHGVSGTSSDAALNYPFVQYLVCAATQTTGTDDTPTGSYAFFSPQNPETDSCPTGWSAATNLNGFFLLPGTSQFAIGSTVGTAIAVNSSNQTIGLPTHTHSYSTSIAVGSISFTGLTGTSSAKGNANAVPVTATLSANSNSNEPVVPVVTMLLCEKTGITSTTQTLPLGMSVFFSAQQCPTDFGVAAASAGSFVVGIGGTGTQAQTFGGQPLVPGQGSGASGSQPMPSHTHTASGSVDLGNNSTYFAGGSDYTFGKGGTYSYSATSGSTEVDLPYAPLMLCAVISNS